MSGSPNSPSHPPVASMVAKALENLNDKKGSSFKAIKKYIANNYIVRMDRLAPYIKRYVKQATYSGNLVQKSGTGAVGSFKLVKPAVSPAKKAKTKTKKMGKKVKVVKKPSDVPLEKSAPLKKEEGAKQKNKSKKISKKERAAKREQKNIKRANSKNNYPNKKAKHNYPNKKSKKNKK